MAKSASFLHNSTLKLVSLLGAILIWAAIQSDITGGRLWDVFTLRGETERSVNVLLHVLQRTELAEPMLLSTNSVTVRVRGETRRMAALRNDAIRAYIDISGGLAGASANFAVRVDLPDGVELGGISPEIIAVSRLAP